MKLKIQKSRIVLTSILLVALAGAALTLIDRRYENIAKEAIDSYNNLNVRWGSDFEIIRTQNPQDNAYQQSYYRKTRSERLQPLVVSLHTWSGSFAQKDELAKLVAEQDWNYVHPDFRGPNNIAEACLSDLALADIDEAISYSIERGGVDRDNIFIVGVSGGGYATLGTFLKSKHEIKAFLSWSPISDLEAWYYQSLAKSERKYAQDIIKCTGSISSLDSSKARERSPIFWNMNGSSKRHLEIYSGINDGHSGSVPISHSIRFYNKIARFQEYARIISGAEIEDLLTRNIDQSDRTIFLDDRAVFFRRSSGPVSITIFDGGHEILPEYTVHRIGELSKKN